MKCIDLQTGLALPFLRSKICDSTWVHSKGPAHLYFSNFDVHSCSRIDTVSKVIGYRSSDLKSRNLILSVDNIFFIVLA